MKSYFRTRDFTFFSYGKSIEYSRSGFPNVLVSLGGDRIVVAYDFQGFGKRLASTGPTFMKDRAGPKNFDLKNYTKS